MLEVEGLTKYFGGLPALRKLDFSVKQGEILGLIGPNGAGKTTVFNLIMGFLLPTRGRVLFKSRDVTKKKPHQVARLGISRTFQLIGIFPDFTVLENMIVASHLFVEISVWDAFVPLRGKTAKERRIREHATGILKTLGLDHEKNEKAGNLSHGHQRLLGIALAMAAWPELLLLDEPLSGMNAEETRHTLVAIKTIRSLGTSILIIEHNMRAVMALCDRIVVINFGMKIAEGLPQHIQSDTRVIEAYLGVSE